MAYIQLSMIRYIRKAGVQITYRPGDWLEIGKDVGKQTAMLWVAEGAASMPHLPIVEQAAVLIGTDWGVVIRSNDERDFEAAKKQVPQARLEVIEGGIELPFERTLLWVPSAPLRPELLPIGFQRLERGWQLAVPLLSYAKLACDYGSSEDRALTKKIIPDLRVLLYDTRLIFVKKCADTERLIKLWKQEPGDERLAFMRALFAVNPIICALPQKWIGDKG